MIRLLRTEVGSALFDDAAEGGVRTMSPGATIGGGRAGGGGSKGDLLLSAEVFTSLLGPVLGI